MRIPRHMSNATCAIWRVPVGLLSCSNNRLDGMIDFGAIIRTGDNQMPVIEMKNSEAVSAKDLAEIVRTFREMRQWSQDTLSALSRLSLRTIQRVENTEPSSADTRRALAAAFELPDIDVFNKPWHMPNMEELQAEVEKIKREHVTLEAQIAKRGQELLRLFEHLHFHYASPAVPLEGAAAEAFAGLTDYLRDFSDAADCMTETDKLRAASDIEEYMATLKQAGFSVVYARREAKLVGRDWPDKTPMESTIVYIVAFPQGDEPKVLVAPRKLNFG